MLYTSELLKKSYKTEEECLNAEKTYLEEKAAKEAEQKQKQEIRSTRAKEVENALKEAVDAEKRYQEILKAFLKDYGSFHLTTSDGNSLRTHSDRSLLDWVFDFLH